VNWLAAYDRGFLRSDAVAGVTLAAFLLPAALADASLAGLPPEAGLYACLFGGLVFWIFCSSRHTAISVTSAISLLVGTSIGDLAGGDAARFWALAMATALLVAALAVGAWAFKAGAVVNFVSETVLLGFKCGIAFVLASTQIPKLFGFSGGEGGFWPRAAHILRHLGETHALSLALGLAALAVLLVGKRLLPGRPVALAVVALGVAATTIFQLATRGVQVLGAVPQGLPPIGLPDVSLSDWNGVFPLAMACFLLAAVETSAIGRMFALKHGGRFDANRELLALGCANALSGLGHGFPISGGMSQSLVNESGGARTPLSGLLAAAILLAVTVGFSGLLANLPKPVLAAIVLAAVTGLVDVKALARLWRFSRTEFGVAAIAFIGVLGQGILRGVLLGAALSLLILIRRASQPNAAELGRIHGSSQFATLSHGDDRERVPGVFVFRIDGGLLYFNADFVRDRFLALLAERSDRAAVAVFLLSAVPLVDLAGADMLAELRHVLRERGIDLRLVAPNAVVRRRLAAAGHEERFAQGYLSIERALSAKE